MQQTVFPIEMEAVINGAARDAGKLRERTPDEIGSIVRNRYVAHNSWVLADPDRGNMELPRSRIRN